MDMRIEQCGWSAVSGWDPSLRTCRLGASAQLVLLFGNADLVSGQECVARIRASFPKAHVFGCSTGGEIQGTRVGDGTLALTAVAFGHSRVAVAKATIASIDQSAAAGEQLVRQLDPLGLRHVLVLSEGLQVSGSDLVAGINAALPAGVSASGGFAADGNSLRKTHVWCDGEPEQSAAVALGFYGDRLRIGVAVTGGWHPFGPDRLITKSRKNVLFEFDGRPALALYKQYLGEHAAGLPATGLNFPLELCVGKRQNRVLRALLAVDEKDQSITFAGDVPEGSRARFMMGHIEDLIGGTHKAAKESLDNLGVAQSTLSLLVSCNARRAVLRQRVEEEVEAARDVFGERTVLTGFYSYGEIGSAEVGAPTELHNETMSITSITEE